MSEHVVVSPKLYFAIFGVLMVMTAVTVWVAYLDLGAMNPMVALGIAAFKATLVLLFFMHLRWSDRLNGLFIGASFVWLAILLVITLSDYLTRSWIPVPGR